MNRFGFRHKISRLWYNRDKKNYVSGEPLFFTSREAVEAIQAGVLANGYMLTLNGSSAPDEAIAKFEYNIFKKENPHLVHRWDDERRNDLCKIATNHPDAKYAILSYLTSDEAYAMILSFQNIEPIAFAYIAIESSDLVTLLRIMNVPLVDLIEVRT